MLLVLLAALAALCTTLSAAADADGWRMTDRFAAFRFETQGAFDKKRFAIAIRNRADDYSGFGWVQITERGNGNVVGEFRGTKRTAALMRAFLQRGMPDAAGYGINIRDYPDTKIRYHFSHFKILDDDRQTCFEQPPHACKAARPGNQAGGAGAGSGRGAPAAGGSSASSSSRSGSGSDSTSESHMEQEL